MRTTRTFTRDRIAARIETTESYPCGEGSFLRPDAESGVLCVILLLSLMYIACEPALWFSGGLLGVTLKTPRVGILYDADGIVVYAADKAWECQSALTYACGDASYLQPQDARSDGVREN
jgi:hypothetical protein